MDELYIEVAPTPTINRFSVPLDSLITIFTLKYCDGSNICLILVIKSESKPSFEIDLTGLSFEIREADELRSMAKACRLPLVLSANGSTCIAGLCAVLRQVIKLADAQYRCLLGFREGCLMACAEVSLWTRFCEIDVIQTVIEVIQREVVEKLVTIPSDIARFEAHMNQPLRIHNIQKKRQELAKASKNGDEILEHAFSEGPSMTLSDIILYPCFHILLRAIGSDRMLDKIPLTAAWFSNMEAQKGVKHSLPFDQCIKRVVLDEAEYELPPVLQQSLYKSDPQRYKPASRIFTRQEDIEISLKIVAEIGLSAPWLDKPFGWDVPLDWNLIPLICHPEGGNLPPSRSDRKRQQLENLAKAVVAVSKPGNTIVDFCSGSGHLGLIIAVVLPRCRVVLLENKFESLDRARKRGESLGLTNVTYMQSNLDYMTGPFDVGVALHACGVATDLVMEQCVARRAAFVVCPCCYGGVQPTHIVEYPRSSLLRGSAISLREYLVLGHAADQTHGEGHAKTEQGNACMASIDADRCMAASERGYRVSINKLEPTTCTPKNNVLVGVPI